MAKDRYTGKGALVKVNDNGDGSTMKTVGLATNITPPPQVKAKIDCTGMEDTTAQIKQGIEEASEFTFTGLWDSQDATDAAIQTLYESGDDVKWEVLTIAGSSTWTMSFTGIVTAVEPQSFGGGDPVSWQVTVARSSTITHAVA